jgi:predicted metal-dependent hydrolase
MNTISYGKKEIGYELQISDRKTLGIAVYPDMNVVVTAPENVSKEKIQEKVKSKARWILKQLRAFEKYQPLSKPKEYVSGETHLYLGRQYVLKVEKAVDNQVKLKGKYLRVKTRNKGKAEELLYDWYRFKAQIHFNSILEDLLPEFEKHDLKIKELNIRKMNTRWGSCTPGGVITLNLHLIKAPKRCIEYVILHELCHLIHHKHDAAFYRLLNSKMPHWKRWKEKLEITLA